MGPVCVLSVLDTAGRHYEGWYLHYTDCPTQRWWTRFLEPGFQHVQLYQPRWFGPGIDDKFWVCVDPSIEQVSTYVDMNPQPPWERDNKAVVQFVRAVPKKDKVRQYFFVGTITCVEITKAHLGLAAFWVRTPYQLYNYIRARDYVLR